MYSKPADSSRDATSDNTSSSRLSVMEPNYTYKQEPKIALFARKAQKNRRYEDCLRRAKGWVITAWFKQLGERS